MKLLRVELENFRCFGKAEFDLTHPQTGKPLEVALLVGENGSGKSAVLQAIAGVFVNLVGEYGADPLQSDDIRSGSDKAVLRIDWVDRISDAPIAPLHVELTVEQQGARFTSDRKRDPAIRSWAKSVAREHRSGLIAAFDVYRILPPQRIAGPNVAGVDARHFVNSLAPTVRRAGEFENRFVQLKQWIVNIDFLRAKAKVDRNIDLPLWDILRRALNTLFAPYEFDRVDEHFNVLFRTPTGTVKLEALSDGFRSMFVIITDLLLRLSLATENIENMLEQEAVCLIDEIDAHLHPKWQERVIPTMRAMFPNVQFIATTHSPYVVGSVEPHNVFLLEEEKEAP